MKFWTKREGSALWIRDDKSAVKFARLPWDTWLQTEIKQPRNLQRLRLRWKLIHIVAEGIGEDDEDISDKIKIACGHYKELHFPDGRIDRKPLSIGYDEMEEIEFQQHFEKEIQAIYMLWGILPEHTRAELNEILAPKTDKYR